MRKLRRARQRHERKNKKFKKRAIAAGTTAVITFGMAASNNRALAQYTPDIHEIQFSHDSDLDLLADSEEDALAYISSNPDQNRNGIPDGVELAKLCAAAFNQLPDCSQAGPNQICKGLAETWGLELCDICGEAVNMGSAWVTNPHLALTVEFPILAIHYMEHGSFCYAGNIHDGRIDVPALLQALGLRLPFDPNDHELAVEKDVDADLLSNKEEFAIGYGPFNSDQNKNEIPDGVELAKRCATVVCGLPHQQQAEPNETYKIEHALDGTERCHICGQNIHMGGWEIINPRLGLYYPDPNDPLNEIFLPDLALHYMQHGSFDCYGDTHKGRVDIPRLLRVLDLRYPCDPNDHQLPLDYVVKSAGQLAPDANDLDGDLLADSEELDSGLNLYDPDQDDNLKRDGIQFAQQCREAIEDLPIYDPYGGGPEPNEPYKIGYFQHGLELCEICGASCNMGCWEIINPKLKLSINVYDIACHYMSHGSFSYSGLDITEPHQPFHNGRIDLVLLAKILEMPRRCGDLGTLYLPGDLNRDCKVNFDDLSDITDKWLESTEPNDG
jgi:hypothetical protein